MILVINTGICIIMLIFLSLLFAIDSFYCKELSSDSLFVDNGSSNLYRRF